MALEALRDKEFWKHKGAEGCRLVGLGMRRSRNDKTAGGEKGVEDARWTGKGHAREWNRGKVVQEEGDKKQKVDVEAAWWRKGGWVFGDFGKAPSLSLNG
jgi:hypothetical protein